MKILELSNYYPEHAGGIEFVASNLVKRWRMHHQVRWVACDVGDCQHVCEADDIPLFAFNFTEVFLGFPFPIPSWKSILRIIEQVGWCDEVHIHDSLYLANLIAYLASRWHHKPLLVTQHVALVPYHEAYKNILQKLAYKTLGKLILGNAERVVFISERVKGWFEKQIHFRNEAILIPNGIDRGLFQPAAASERGSIRTGLGFQSDDLVCLFVGRFTQKKGVLIVRDIARSQPNVRWLMIGQGELSPRRWNLPNVEVVPPQPQAALRKYYVATDLFVLPSVGEGFPLVVQEALSCGLPVAVSQETGGSMPDAPLVKLDVTSLPLLLKTLNELFVRPEALSEMRQQAAEYAKRWDWEIAAKEYEDVLASLAQNSHRGR